jgi:hypothetical protein
LWEGEGGRGRSFGALRGYRPARGDGNRLKHAFQVAGDFAVPNPKDAEALTLHPGITLGISPAIDVSGAVNLNDQSRGWTKEVGNVEADRDLASKLESVQPLSPKPVPKQLLCPCAVQPH